MRTVLGQRQDAPLNLFLGFLALKDEAIFNVPDSDMDSEPAVEEPENVDEDIPEQILECCSSRYWDHDNEAGTCGDGIAGCGGENGTEGITGACLDAYACCNDPLDFDGQACDP